MKNYTNKHITFNKGEYVGWFEPASENITDTTHSDVHSTHNVTTQKMIAGHVEPDTFDLPLHKLKHSIKTKLNALLEEYASKFVKDETSIGTTPLTKVTIDLQTCLSEALPHHYEELPMG